MGEVLLSNTSLAVKPYIPPGLSRYYVPDMPSRDIAAVKPLQYWIFKDGYLLVDPRICVPRFLPCSWDRSNSLLASSIVSFLKLVLVQAMRWLLLAEVWLLA